MKTVLILLGVTMLFSISVKSSALMKSPWNDDLGNLLTMIFDCENSIQNLKYDRKTEQWVEECPDIECEHGVDDGGWFPLRILFRVLDLTKQFYDS